ncbi:hypothetical protein AOC36_11685 (plasmid) [Erysipelothrix larvae]|uniref:DUF6431 domain-containing protein n=1 Tax=Erysipelothrix larvae TaxID=1514105 RepID=A0A0X8H0G4_9FIRM|nr:DUF6431 domain-containing protein [Erysipelothrix larvae]AMC92557.1 hypothetical protein AOC36_00670 [Erysipelothrix larvae]AMC92831.1 hypothetical protein AOC36_02170 [Erysipelothrix larvae]AMC92839.1 hypothetical protein AOC36_02210 [Erysipelothrix larvae]AMC92908.1 hypothetical protein AOC36_02580 [Erysipelothrix larvae]AMC93161.1 hypothetical protein AOC36_03995 [Erysipelothrix larvae]
MITVFSNTFNNKQFSQKEYYKFLNSINPKTIPCPCCSKTDTLIRYGYYPKTIITGRLTIVVEIARFFCNQCKRTHAIIPSNLLPYFQLSVPTIEIILTHELDSTLLTDIDESTYIRIKIRFNDYESVRHLSYLERLNYFILSTKRNIYHSAITSPT